MNGKEFWWRRAAPRVMRAFLALMFVGGVGVGATVATQAVTQGTAFANVPVGSEGVWVGNSNGGATWNVNLYRLNVSVRADAAIASGQCAILGFDWKLSPVHHMDATLARSCKPNGTYGSPTFTDAISDEIGMQKLGACQGNQGHETSYTCVNAPDAETSVTGISMTATCQMSWTMLRDGTTQYNSGGDRFSCTS